MISGGPVSFSVLTSGAYRLSGGSFFGKVSGLVILWSLWAVFFSEINNIFISSIVLSSVCLGLGLIAPLIDFNESHATNPLWTGHSRFHLVWQVNALAVTGFFVLFLLWIVPSQMNILISIVLLYIWLLSFVFALLFMPLYDGKLNDVNGVPPIEIDFFGNEIKIDRNVQAISGGLFACTYALLLVIFN